MDIPALFQHRGRTGGLRAVLLQRDEVGGGHRDDGVIGQCREIHVSARPAPAGVEIDEQRLLLLCGSYKSRLELVFPRDQRCRRRLGCQRRRRPPPRVSSHCLRCGRVRYGAHQHRSAQRQRQPHPRHASRGSVDCTLLVRDAAQIIATTDEGSDGARIGSAEPTAPAVHGC